MVMNNGTPARRPGGRSARESGACGTATYEFGSGKSFGWAQRICGADASEAWSPPVIAPYAAESRIGIAADSVRQ